MRLSKDLGRRWARAIFKVTMQRVQAGKVVGRSVRFVTQLADRLTDLADGAVCDVPGARFFGSGSRQIEDRISDLDGREHVLIHSERESRHCRVHTHGLIEFGRPEFEYTTSRDPWKTTPSP